MLHFPRHGIYGRYVVPGIYSNPESELFCHGPNHCAITVSTFQINVPESLEAAFLYRICSTVRVANTLLKFKVSTANRNRRLAAEAVACQQYERILGDTIPRHLIGGILDHLVATKRTEQVNQHVSNAQLVGQQTNPPFQLKNITLTNSASCKPQNSSNHIGSYTWIACKLD